MSVSRRIVSGTFYEPKSFDKLSSMVAFVDTLIKKQVTEEGLKDSFIPRRQRDLDRKLALDLADAIGSMAESRLFSWESICGDVFTWMLRNPDWTVVWSTGANPHLLLYSVSAKELAKRANKVVQRFKPRVERRGWDPNRQPVRLSVVEAEVSHGL